MKIWSEILNELFVNSIPKYSIWDDNASISNILTNVGKHDNSNHMFYPDGGGFDLKSVEMAAESDCVELNTGLIDIVKPRKLSFHRLDDIEQSYFRLELYELPITGNGDVSESTEQLCEIESGVYINSDYYDEGSYNGEPLPNSARYVQRILKGSLVIFSKNSMYNRHHPTYDGRHNLYSEEDFFDYVNKGVKQGFLKVPNKS